MAAHKIPVDKRFWEKVNKLSDGECWEWNACIDKRTGYGLFNFDNKSVNAHRVSWIIAFGEIPNGLWVLHKCDNPPCVNPNHLFLGTVQDNNADRHSKGRTRSCFGESVRTAKLNDSQIREIRFKYWKQWLSYEEIGSHYGIDASGICRIIIRESWKHVI